MPEGSRQLFLRAKRASVPLARLMLSPGLCGLGCSPIKIKGEYSCTGLGKRALTYRSHAAKSKDVGRVAENRAAPIAERSTTTATLSFAARTREKANCEGSISLKWQGLNRLQEPVENTYG